MAPVTAAAIVAGAATAAATPLPHLQPGHQLSLGGRQPWASRGSGGSSNIPCYNEPETVKELGAQIRRYRRNPAERQGQFGAAGCARLPLTFRRKFPLRARPVGVAIRDFPLRPPISALTHFFSSLSLPSAAAQLRAAADDDDMPLSACVCAHGGHTLGTHTRSFFFLVVFFFVFIP